MTENPLSKYFRKPAIYISLPSKGHFNPEIDQTMIDEVGVLPMTAIDEIGMRSPDALLNGEAMISLIKSCVPSIPNVRNLCNIDVEALYLAIQYATYGKDITHSHKCSKCGSQSDFNIDINFLLNKFPEIDKVEPILYEDLVIHLRLPSLESVTRVALIRIEEQRIIKNIQTESVDETDEVELAKRFYSSFKRVANHNVDLLGETIAKIETPNGDVTDRLQIKEFLSNIPSNIVEKINKTVEGITKRPDDLSKFNFVCPENECGHKEDVQLELNPVNFSKAG